MITLLYCCILAGADNQSKNKITFPLTLDIIGLTQIVFIILKLCDAISWQWYYVSLPTIISVGVFVVVFLIALLVAGICTVIDEAKYKIESKKRGRK